MKSAVRAVIHLLMLVCLGGCVRATPENSQASGEKLNPYPPGAETPMFWPAQRWMEYAPKPSASD